jgi:hypothetical protein
MIALMQTADPDHPVVMITVTHVVVHDSMMSYIQIDQFRWSDDDDDDFASIIALRGERKSRLF